MDTSFIGSCYRKRQLGTAVFWIFATILLSQYCDSYSLAASTRQIVSHHTVRRGETLYTIARRYRLNYRELAKTNRIRPPYLLKPGQKLRVSIARKKRWLKRHVVRRGETVYSIAWRYDLDYRDLAKKNQIRAPYSLKIGQILRITPDIFQKKYMKKNATRWKKTVKLVSNKYRYSTVRHWMWPAKGKLVQRFALEKGRKGIDIAGRYGQIIRATAGGKVAYAGSGLRGYGLLLIVKHNSRYLSAYAHNRKLLVKDGQWVKEGQKIAEMGNSAKNRAMLHFEIRRVGRPVNPLRYLQK